jgi:hypothetical protein
LLTGPVNAARGWANVPLPRRFDSSVDALIGNLVWNSFVGGRARTGGKDKITLEINSSYRRFSANLLYMLPVEDFSN